VALTANGCGRLGMINLVNCLMPAPPIKITGARLVRGINLRPKIYDASAKHENKLRIENDKVKIFSMLRRDWITVDLIADRLDLSKKSVGKICQEFHRAGIADFFVKRGRSRVRLLG
jgi:hypothetical protein